METVRSCHTYGSFFSVFFWDPMLKYLLIGEAVLDGKLCDREPLARGFPHSIATEKITI